MRAQLLPIWPSAPRRDDTLRLRLDDGARTTLHVAAYDLRRVRPAVVALPRPMRLLDWCREHGEPDAIVGGFFVRPDGHPLGELRIAGSAVASEPFDAPWNALRACVHVENGTVRFARRPALPAEPAGDLLQAGPLLVAGGRSALRRGDVEGFSAGAGQFDSDITDGRYPRAALAVGGDRLFAAVCDGRGHRDAGLTLPELAAALIELGADEAINLDGGGSATLVTRGRLRNRPREAHGIALAGGRPISTAIVLRTA